ncbi:MAG: RNA-binding protein [Gammaproteobacteria bacterium]|nr:RNA-binding protein [Gammaproteobacteria bacterium]MBU1654847.1 RNA-binding protein [Gammaproteobacteria bacterium]MBU1961138.1 RNA-binding protein [Gammaproteobacteria bacterium]
MPVIEKCEIIEVYDEESLESEYHGVVKFKDPDAGERAMKKLRGKLLGGQYVRVREFYYRSPGDRRNYGDDLDDFISVSYRDRRKPVDRRRPKLVTKRYSYSPRTASYESVRE